MPVEAIDVIFTFLHPLRSDVHYFKCRCAAKISKYREEVVLVSLSNRSDATCKRPDKQQWRAYSGSCFCFLACGCLSQKAMLCLSSGWLWFITAHCYCFITVLCFDCEKWCFLCCHFLACCKCKRWFYVRPGILWAILVRILTCATLLWIEQHSFNLTAGSRKSGTLWFVVLVFWLFWKHK